MRFAFSTDTIAPAGRFETFRDALARGMFQFELISHARAPYHGVVDLDVGGPVQFGQVLGSAAEFFRTPALTQRCEPGAWVLLTRSGLMRLSQNDACVDVAPGAGVVVDPVHAHAGRCVAESDTWVVQVPETLLHGRRTGPGRRQPVALPADSAVTRMILSVLDAHHRLDVEAREAVAVATGLYLADLVALAIGADGGHPAGNGGIKAARRQLVLDDIAHRYLDHGLRAEDVARRLGITPRYVHRLLEETGRTFSDCVHDHRLAYGRRLLLERRTMRVADVACACGFSDLSYFNRTYRARYGEAPTQTRAL